MSEDLVLRFWGVRGSIASNPSKIGNHTSCVELEISPDHSLVFDAGTGIRAASSRRKLRKMTLFISHFHWDHIQGLPFISSLSDSDFELQILSGFHDTEERLKHLFDERFHPVSLKHYGSKINIQTLKPGDSYSLEGLELRCAPLNHPGTSYACLVEGAQVSVLYATDSDYDPVPDETQQLFRKSDWAIVDSQFLLGDAVKKFDYGHASFQHAIDTCAKFNVKDCYLFHFDPNYDDHQLEQIEDQARRYVEDRYLGRGPKVWMAREGMERRIGR